MLLLHLPVSTESAGSIWDLLSVWQVEPLVMLPLLAFGGLYARGQRRLSVLRQRAVGAGSSQTAWFACGYLAVALALLSPIHAFSEELFFVHMVQHVLLMSVAAPLLLLANPMPVLLWSLPRGPRAMLGQALAPDGPLVAALRLLTNPLVAWWLFVLNLWLWHRPGAYQAALGSELIHHLQHLLFFFTAVLFWWPVIGPSPLRSRLRYPLRMLYVFLTWMPNSLLGAGITFAPAVLMPFYEARPRHWGIDPLTDQQVAGLIMWVPGDLIYAAAMLCLLIAALRQEDRAEAQLTLNVEP